MARAHFPYVGGKSRHADWIIEHIPEHTCYIEPFGGSAAVLTNKPPSEVEVYNDADGVVVTFFRVLRDRPDELIRWLRKTPYSRKFHSELNEKLYGDGTPENELEAAGGFYYLRYTSYAGTRDGSFKRSQYRPDGRWEKFAKHYNTSRERLDELADRFEGVVVECDDYSEVLREYDAPDSFFYCDPPYVGTEHYYQGDFDHQRFVDTLCGLEGKWMVSYSDLPPGLGEYHVLERDAKHSGDNSNGQKSVTERLVLNYDPETTALHIDSNQQTLPGTD